jgi:hypothetical protein
MSVSGPADVKKRSTVEPLVILRVENSTWEIKMSFKNNCRSHGMEFLAGPL